MNSYQFEQIARRLQKDHGKLRKGEEDQYSMMFFPMESNAVKVHRNNPEAGDSRMKEAINLVLHQVDGRIRGEMPDTSAFENPENVLLRDALLMAFDPFTNEEIRASLTQNGDELLEDKEYLKRFYHAPILCLMRIQESIDFWGQYGTNGYFQYLERNMGHMIPHDQKMNYSVELIEAGGQHGRIPNPDRGR